MESQSYATSRKISLAIPADMIERLEEIASRSGVSYSKVLESLLYFDDEAIMRKIEEAKPLIAAAQRKRRASKKAAADLLAKLTPEELAAVQKMAEGSN